MSTRLPTHGCDRLFVRMEYYSRRDSRIPLQYEVSAARGKPQRTNADDESVVGEIGILRRCLTRLAIQLLGVLEICRALESSFCEQQAAAEIQRLSDQWPHSRVCWL